MPFHEVFLDQPLKSFNDSTAWRHFLAVLLLTLTFASVAGGNEPPSSLAGAKREQALDEAESEGIKLAKAAACGLEPYYLTIAAEAQFSYYSATEPSQARALKSAFERGRHTEQQRASGDKTCFVAAFGAGQLAQQKGAYAAKDTFKAKLIPRTMGAVGNSRVGVISFVQGYIVNSLAWCIEDDRVRDILSEFYVREMGAFMDAYDFPRTEPGNMMYPFEVKEGPFKTKIGGDASWPLCQSEVFGAGEATEVLHLINGSDGSVRDQWLVKRLFGN